MVQCSSPQLDWSFAALADATRRGVLQDLARADASITQLADRFALTLTGMKKHVAVLERAGLVVTAKVGRVRTCRLARLPLVAESAWMDELRTLWTERFDALDAVVSELERQEESRLAEVRSPS